MEGKTLGQKTSRKNTALFCQDDVKVDDELEKADDVADDADDVDDDDDDGGSQVENGNIFEEDEVTQISRSRKML
jgi:hypothetical protein